MQKLLATQVKMPKSVTAGLCGIPVVMLGVVTFLLVESNSSTMTRNVQSSFAEKSVLFNVPGHEYQLRTFRATKSRGTVSYLRWVDSSPSRKGELLLGIYYDDVAAGITRKRLGTFEGPSSGARFYWSKDGSLFVVFSGSHPVYAYDFQKHKTLVLASGFISVDPQPKAQEIEVLFAQRGGKAEASFSQARWISFAEFQKFPKHS